MKKRLDFLRYVVTEKYPENFYNEYRNKVLDYIKYIEDFELTEQKDRAIYSLYESITSIIGTHSLAHAYTCYSGKYTKKEKFVFTDLVIEGI